MSALGSNNSELERENEDLRARLRRLGQVEGEAVALANENDRLRHRLFAAERLLSELEGAIEDDRFWGRDRVPPNLKAAVERYGPQVRGRS